MKASIFLAVLICSFTFSVVTSAQQDNAVTIDPLKAGAQVHGNAWASLRSRYVRLEDSAEALVRKPVWDLSRNSAGLSLVFRSNSSRIVVDCTVRGGMRMIHMPATGVSGVDLFAYDSRGNELWCAAKFFPLFTERMETLSDGKKRMFTDVHYNYDRLDYQNGESYEYHLYLPLYNTIEKLELSVDEGCEFEFLPIDARRPVVVYGTSIAQGACASRPGMAWTNIVERKLRYPVVNLGFSGNGKFEPELFDLLCSIDASVYVIDCLPNSNADDPFESRLEDGIRKLKAHNGAAIVLIGHSGYTNDKTNYERKFPDKLNERQKALFIKLKKEGMKNLFYITREDINWGKDSMVEGIHPNDFGMMQQADAVVPVLRKILRRSL